ncbi:MAG: peptidylprolyl isomerase [Acidiferrobacterales bacterium]|nr:peptidylprolyl isomerase [Acidiferrobacterales bacterium]
MWVRSLSVSAVVALSLAISSVWGQSDSLDRIVVTVNGDPITETDIERRIRLLNFDVRQAGGSDLADDVVRPQAIETEISQLLKRQEASFLNIHVFGEEISNRLEQLSSQNNVPVDEFLSHFESQGLTLGDIRLSVGEGLMDEKLTQLVFMRRIEVREDEIDRYLSANQSEFEGGEQYDLSVIVIPDSNQMSFAARAEYRQLSNEIEGAIKSGIDFRRITDGALHIEGVEAGNLGWIPVNGIAPEVLAAVSKVRVGEVVGPIKTADRIVFAAVNNHTTSGLIDLPQIREFHLARIVLHASNEAGLAVVAEQLADLRRTIVDGADFGSMAKLYSNDSTTRFDGGDMGWVTEDNMPFEYLELLQTMQPGDLSPVQTFANNVYILQLRGFRIGSAEVSKRSVVRDRLRNVKLRKESAEWVDQLRATAAIKYRKTFGS